MSLPIIRRAAFNLLARRDYSQQEMIQKLKTKGYAVEEIKIIIDDLVKANYIDDARFSENYIRRRRHKGYGPKRIQLELQIHGIAAEIIAQQLQFADNAWFIEVKKIWSKYFKGKTPPDMKNRAKQMRFLQYRGFTQDQIENVIKIWE